MVRSCPKSLDVVFFRQLSVSHSPPMLMMEISMFFCFFLDLDDESNKGFRLLRHADWPRCQLDEVGFVQKESGAGNNGANTVQQKRPKVAPVQGTNRQPN